MYPNPYQITKIPTKSLLSSIKAIDWKTLLDSTQKTLGVINQAIPVVYQIRPIVNNAKTLFKIAGAVNEPTQNIEEETKEVETNKTQKSQSNSSPIFYI